MERQKFEDSFKEAFQRAEVDPSDHVWTNIELDLERLESGKMKRRLLVFKFVAAASVIFAMAIGGTGYLFYRNNIQQPQDMQIAQNSDNEHGANANELSAEKEDALVFEKQDGREGTSETRGINITNERTQSSVTTTKQNSLRSNDASINPAAAMQNANIAHTVKSKDETGGSAFANGGSHQNLSSNEIATLTSYDKSESALLSDRRLPGLVQLSQASVPDMPNSKLSEVDLLMIRLAEDKKLEEEATEKRQSADERIWTSVGFSAGTFNSVNTSNPSNPTLMQSASLARTSNFTAATNTLSNETTASGLAYSVGISVGGKLSNRWVIQGGLNYLQQNSNFTSDAVVTTDHQKFSAPSSVTINEAALSNVDQSVIITAPYNVNNNIQFISFPIQAGFIVINKSLGLQINGGFSTDLFLQNTVTPTQGSLSKATYGRGKDSPYRPLNFSGLLGTELSYRFADRYRVSLNPGIRYPFSSIYKSDVGLESVPVTFDVGLRFRYIFQ